MNHISRVSIATVVGLIATCTFLLSCSSSNTEKWLEHRQLRAEHVSALEVHATHNMIVQGERTRIGASGMVGNHVRDLNQYVTFHVNGPGSIEQEGSRVWFVGDSENGEDGTDIWATYNHEQFGTETPPGIPRVIKSEKIVIYVRPADERIDMPNIRQYGPRHLEMPNK